MTGPLASLAPLRLGAHAVEPLILAPMAGVSELPFRRLARQMGAGLAPTELISAKGLEVMSARTEAYLRTDPEVDAPFVVQLFGGDPAVMARGAEIAASRGAQVIDVNMGCPVPKITKSGAGSALLLDPPRAAAIVRTIRQRTGLPVTVKLRAGWDDRSIVAPELAPALEEAGAIAIAVHGRTRAQGYSGRADLSVIAAVKARVKVPVIVNGDIRSVLEAERALLQTGADAVMIGRAALGAPWIFREFAARRRGEAVAELSAAERALAIARHFREQLVHAAPALRAVQKFRQMLIWYAERVEGYAAFRAQVIELVDPQAIEALILEHFSRQPLLPPEAVAFDERTAHG
ncbi:MAG: tRNA dihydrouridine synthase DusB [Myxococcota bacterium]